MCMTYMSKLWHMFLQDEKSIIGDGIFSFGSTMLFLKKLRPRQVLTLCHFRASDSTLFVSGTTNAPVRFTILL